MKTIKCLIALLVAFILSWETVAQNNYVDCLYLKNGSILKGVILEQSPSGPIKIQTGDGSVFVYPLSDVLKITKEEQQGPKFGYIQPNPYEDPVPAGLLSWSWENEDRLDVKPVVKVDQQYVISGEKLYDLLGETNSRMFEDGYGEYLRGSTRQYFAWWTGGATLGGVIATALSAANEDGLGFVCLGATLLAGGATLFLILSGGKKMEKGEALINQAIGNYNDDIKNKLSFDPVLKVQPTLVCSHFNRRPVPGLSLTLYF